MRTCNICFNSERKQSLSFLQFWSKSNFRAAHENLKTHIKLRKYIFEESEKEFN